MPEFGDLSVFSRSPQIQIKGNLQDRYIMQTDGETAIIREKPGAVVNRREFSALLEDESQVGPYESGFSTMMSKKTTGPVPLNTENDEW